MKKTRKKTKNIIKLGKKVRGKINGYNARNRKSKRIHRKSEKNK